MEKLEISHLNHFYQIRSKLVRRIIDELFNGILQNVFKTICPIKLFLLEVSSQNARYEVRCSISRPQNDIDCFQDIEMLRYSLRLLNDRYCCLRDRPSIPTNARWCCRLLGLCGRDSWLPLLHMIESFLDGSQSFFQASGTQNAYL